MLNLEKTYLVRLFGEFEGILKDHLVSNHPTVRFNEKQDKVDRLLRLIMKHENVTISPSLRNKLDELRGYRNSIAHQSHLQVPMVTLADAALTLSQIVSRFDLPLK